MFLRSFLPALSLLAAVLIYFFYLSPGLETVNVLKEEIAQFDIALAQTREIESTLERLRTQYLGISQTDRERLEKFLPTSVNDVGLVNEVSNIAAQHGLILDDVRIQDETIPVPTGKEKADYASQVLSFTVAAEYEQFYGFLKDAEKSLRLMDLESINVAVSQTIRGSVVSDTTTFTVELKVYSLN